MVNSKYFLSVSILMAVAGGVYSPITCAESRAQNAIDATSAHTYNDSGDTAMHRQHAEQLETLTKIIRVLRETREIKCTTEEKVLVNRLLDTINNPSPKKLLSEEYNCEIAHKLRRVVQIFGLSSPSLDNAQGSSPYETTNAIIRALQACLAERNITDFHRTFRTIINTLEPYKTALVITALPLIFYGACRLNAAMQTCFVKALELDLTGLPTKSSVATNPATAPAPATSPNTKTATSPYISDSWKLFSQALILPAAGIMYKYLDTTIFKDALEKATDQVKKIWAKLQGLPAGSSNPASSSKVALKDVPASLAIKEHLQALARMTISQEDVYKQQGGAGLKTILIHGDTSLAQLLAFGLADEVVRLARENGTELACPVAVVHASKFSKTTFRDILDKVTTYNKACVIVIQDLDWVIDEATYSAIVSEIIGGIKSATRLHEQYIVVGTARNLANVDIALKQSSIFGTRLMVNPSHDSSLLKACIERAEQIYGINITQNTLRAQLEAYICNHSFGDFMNLFAAAYTKSLPQVCAQALDEHAIARELALVEPTAYALS